MRGLETRVPEPLLEPSWLINSSLPQKGDRRPDGTPLGREISTNEWLRGLGKYVEWLTADSGHQRLSLPPIENRYDLEKLAETLDQLLSVLPAVFNQVVSHIQEHSYHTDKQRQLLDTLLATIVTSQQRIFTQAEQLRVKLARLTSRLDSHNDYFSSKLIVEGTELPLSRLSSGVPLKIRRLLTGMVGMTTLLPFAGPLLEHALAGDRHDRQETAAVVDDWLESEEQDDAEKKININGGSAAGGLDAIDFRSNNFPSPSTTATLRTIEQRLNEFEDYLDRLDEPAQETADQVGQPAPEDEPADSLQTALSRALSNPDTVVISSLDRSATTVTVGELEASGWQLSPWPSDSEELLEQHGRIKLQASNTTGESATYWINHDQLPPIETEPVDLPREATYQPLPDLSTAQVRPEFTQGANVRSEATVQSQQLARLVAGYPVTIVDREIGQAVSLNVGRSDRWYRVVFTNDQGELQMGTMSALLLTEPEAEPIPPTFRHQLSNEFLEQLIRQFPGASDQESFALTLLIPEDTNQVLTTFNRQALNQSDIAFVRSIDNMVGSLIERDEVQVTENTRTVAIITVNQNTRQVSISFKHEQRPVGEGEDSWQTTELFGLVDGDVVRQPVKQDQVEMVIQLDAQQVRELRELEDPGFNQLQAGEYALVALSPDGTLPEPVNEHITPLIQARNQLIQVQPADQGTQPEQAESPAAVPVPEPPQNVDQRTPSSRPPDQEVLDNFVTQPAAIAELSTHLTPEAIDRARELSLTTQPTLTEDGRIVLPTPYDPQNNPRYEWRNGRWRDQHPGRQEIDDTLPNNFFAQFSPEALEWDSEYTLYRLKESNQLFVSVLGTELINGSYDTDDLRDGRTTVQFELESPDFELGVEGVRISILLSRAHPDITQLGLWGWTPEMTRALTETLLDSFPGARGRHLIYAVAADDITGEEPFYRDNGLRGDQVNMIGIRHHPRLSNLNTLIINTSIHLSDRSEFPDNFPKNYHLANYGERVLTAIFLGTFRTFSGEDVYPQRAFDASGLVKKRIRETFTDNEERSIIGEDRPYSLVVTQEGPVFND